MFQEDRDDGTLDALILGPMPLELVTVSKSAAHWITTCVPLMLTTPLAALLLNLDAGILPKLLASFLIGTLGISFIATAGAALTLGLRRGALLLPLMILPLFTPFLIFGVGALSEAPGAFTQSLLFLGGLSLFAAAIMPFAAALALRVGLE
jgi:heme exporter protein B